MSSIILSALVFSPVLGILFLIFLPKEQEASIKLTGFFATFPAAIIAIILFVQYMLGTDPAVFAEKARWMSFGPVNLSGETLFAVDYELGADGFSLAMLLLTAILAVLSAAASFKIQHSIKGYFLLFLLLEIGMLGVFASQNMILFFLFLEITLVPMFFLIGKWGYGEREKAAYSYLLYNGAGSAALLIVTVLLFSLTGTSNIAKLQELISSSGAMSSSMQLGLLLALLFAFGVKLPVVPLHSWMLKVHVEAPPPVVMLHSGVLLKIGAYGLIRLGLGIFPEAFHSIGYILIILGLVNLFYGAFLALIQYELKRILAFSSVSHMGIVLIGLGALNEAGIQGAIFQSVSHGFISALLFFMIGILYSRFQTTDIRMLKGLAKPMPIAAGFLMAACMASLGLPGLSGFISEFLAFLGLFHVQPELGAIGALGLILTAAYLLRALLSVSFGKAENSLLKAKDLTWHETVPVLVLILFIAAIGVYPNLLALPLQVPIETILQGAGG
ncbi:NADH-quinone oxidoreductase subunit M [Metabacillus sp. GX 13764]|uniref:complex I subunit 4 family protein n=1 Tax=Metabacillus kandeliae TaxID=2900151 RepID=UPI001E65BCB9|nr:NADH-quinone oxidoreductase subunit M [Metabacillus kandeliae]MCD7034648.1 NADH-quinone oxidoreductase subunit M [Metabacillus kandeliae]